MLRWLKTCTMWFYFKSIQGYWITKKLIPSMASLEARLCKCTIFLLIHFIYFHVIHVSSNVTLVMYQILSSNTPTVLTFIFALSRVLKFNTKIISPLHTDRIRVLSLFKLSLFPLPIRSNSRISLQITVFMS
jgi:hypothetical protein